MKNVLILSLGLFIVSTTALSQEQNETTKIKKVEVSKEQAKKLKSAKKVVKAQSAKKVKAKAVREEQAAKREED